MSGGGGRESTFDTNPRYMAAPNEKWKAVDLDELTEK